MENLVLEALEKQGERLTRIESLMMGQSKSVLNLDELCSHTGLSKSHVYKRTMKGEIPHYKQAKHLFFDRLEIEQWLKEFKIKTVSELQREAATYVTLNQKGSKI